MHEPRQKGCRVGSRDQYLSQPISAVDQKAAIKQEQNAAPFISAFGCGFNLSMQHIG